MSDRLTRGSRRMAVFTATLCGILMFVSGMSAEAELDLVLLVSAIGFLVVWAVTSLVGWVGLRFVHSDSPGGRDTGEVAADDEE